MTEHALPAARSAARPVSERGANLRGVYIIWYRDVLRYTRDRTRLVVSFAQPLLYLLIFGTGLGSTLAGGRSFGGLHYQQLIRREPRVDLLQFPNALHGHAGRDQEN